MTVDPLTVYPCLEWVLAEEISFPIESVVHARRQLLHRGADWDRVRGRIRLTSEARIRLLEVLKPAALDLAPNTPIPPSTVEINGASINPETFPHAEAELATRLGIRGEDLRGIRAFNLERGVHWEMVKGEVRLSPEGLEHLIAVLAIPVSALAISEPSTPAAPPVTQAAPSSRQPGSQEELVCFKCYKPNWRMLEAKTAAGDLVLVRVRDNSNFLPGMKMKCRFASTPIWELAQRLPRRRGRW